MSSENENKNSLGKRFAGERKRCGFTQAGLAEACLKTREAIGKYERDLIIPGGDVLLRCYQLGFNIGYVLTGVTTGADDLGISGNVRDLTDDQKNMVNQIIDELATRNKESSTVKDMAQGIQSLLKNR